MKLKKNAVIAILVLGLLVANASAKIIERENYRITVPSECTIDPKDKDFDLEHMTTVNFPNGNTMNISVLDEKSVLFTVLQSMIDSYRTLMKNPEVYQGTFLRENGWESVVVMGKLNGAKFRFDIRALSGRKCAVIIVTTALQSETADQLIMGKAAESLRIKN